jgi:hypothetical protein
MSTLKAQLESLASSFAADVVSAIRGASLEELLGGAAAGARRGPGRPPKAAASAPAAPARAARAGRARGGRGGRLARRSPDDIAKSLAQVVALLKTKKDGLRSEQIRSTLKMRSNEMPRVLKDGLAKKALKSKGQKRATTYFAA